MTTKKRPTAKRKKVVDTKTGTFLLINGKVTENTFKTEKTI